MALTPIAECSLFREELPPPSPKVILNMKQSAEGLQRCMSDVSPNVSKNLKELHLSSINEVQQAECECCGMSEDYTVGYVGEVRGCHHGKWVCGICSADIKERLAKVPNKADMEEALVAHMAACKKYNKTMRINPTLSLAGAMRDIVRKCRDGGAKEGRSGARVARTSSCVPRINFERDRLRV